MSQLQMPFVAEIDLQLAKDRAAADKKRHEDWAASILKSMVKGYPPSSEECDVMLRGIRLSRFVSNLECESCNLATEDHTRGFLWCSWSETHKQYIPIKFCLKDFYRIVKRR